MKNRLITNIALSALIGTLLLFGASCSKKTIMPPTSDASSTESGMDGKDINYPMAEGGYSEDNLPAEGSLDDSTGGGSGVGMGVAAHQQSDEYKRAHGRSSTNLEPIYFDFDQAGVRPDMTEVLVRNSDYLITIPGAMVVVEGNSDERGTNEYNLALGERRAINAQQYLINLGIEPRRLRTLSYGEENPLFMGQDEDSFSHNRRVDFVIQ